jgi:glycerate kinase
VSRFVVAPDKFRGTIDAAGAAAALARGLRGVRPLAEILCVPMADGGEGTVDAFVESGWTRRRQRVRGPLGDDVDASFAFSAGGRGGPVAIVEMAAASGLALVRAEDRDPLRASSFGTGELIRAALDDGARRIAVTLGGSATSDGGAGMLAALGVKLTNEDGAELRPGGAALAELVRVDAGALDPRLRNVTLEVAADVDNPLLGPRGASAVFGPQKGATADDVALLEAALANFADVTRAALGRDVRAEAGTGAAGGLGFALRAYLGARPQSGVELIADLRGLREALCGAAWCFTGEGAIDVQTLAGKTVAGVAKLAREAGAGTIAFAGRLEAGAERALAEAGIVAVPIADGPLSLAEAGERVGELLERAAARVARLLPP